MHGLNLPALLPTLTKFSAIAVAALIAGSPAQARGPENVSDVAEKVIDAVVNISTSQTVSGRPGRGGGGENSGGGADNNARPQLPPGSPYEDFFEDLLKNRRGGGDAGPRKVNSLGSGFIIDESGIVVTNNHVIAEADEINVILNDGTKLRAEIVGRDVKTDLAVLKVKSDKPLQAVKFGDSDVLRLGEWVVAIGNPFSLGGTVTAGIISARNRDIKSGDYDNYIQTDAAINRGNSGGPLFNLNGDVVGVNTAIISPSGGSIGIGFAVPSKTVERVVSELRDFGEARRGWLGVKIQPVTDELAETLGIKPVRGVLLAGIDEKGPAKPAGLEPLDVVIKFDGRDVKEVRDLQRIVAETPAGKEVDVVIIRKGQEQTRKVTLARLEEEKPVQASAKSSSPVELPKTPTQKALGLELAGLSKDLRARYKIKDSVNGVVITSVERNSNAAEQRLSAGDVIIAAAQEAVDSAAALQKRIDEVKKNGGRYVLLQVANPDGDIRFVTLSVN